jgi:GNAT superfamily N-acetyltransferase
MPEGASGARPETGVHIRAARPEDAESIVALILGLAEFEKLPPPDEAAQQRLLQDAFGERPRFEVFLAEVGSRAVGYAFVFETYSTFLALPTLYLEDIFVVPEYRGRAVGYTMIRFLAALAHERGCGRMEWVVLDWNRPAIDFYERLGAQHLGEWLTYRLDRDALSRLAAEG